MSRPYLEDDVELRVEVRLETLPLQDGLELVEKLQRMLDGRDILEALVDERLGNSGKTYTQTICHRLPKRWTLALHCRTQGRMVFFPPGSSTPSYAELPFIAG